MFHLDNFWYLPIHWFFLLLCRINQWAQRHPAICYYVVKLLTFPFDSFLQFLSFSWNYPPDFVCCPLFVHTFNINYSDYSEVTQSCPTLCDPMDCSLPGSSVHGIFQARVLEWVAISFSRGSSQPRDQTGVSGTTGRCFTVWAIKEAPNINYSHFKFPYQTEAPVLAKE